MVTKLNQDADKMQALLISRKSDSGIGIQLVQGRIAPPWQVCRQGVLPNFALLLDSQVAVMLRCALAHST